LVWNILTILCAVDESVDDEYLWTDEFPTLDDAPDFGRMTQAEREHVQQDTHQKPTVEWEPVGNEPKDRNIFEYQTNTSYGPGRHHFTETVTHLRRLKDIPQSQGMSFSLAN
jgi:hypothetical protein